MTAELDLVDVQRLDVERDGHADARSSPGWWRTTNPPGRSFARPTIATHAVYDHLRSVRKSPEWTGLDDALELVTSLPDPFDVVVERVAARIIEELSEKDRSFVLLFFGAELEPALVASRLRITLNTVCSKKHKIRGHFQSMLRLASDGEMQAPTLAA